VHPVRNCGPKRRRAPERSDDLPEQHAFSVMLLRQSVVRLTTGMPASVASAAMPGPRAAMAASAAHARSVYSRLCGSSVADKSIRSCSKSATAAADASRYCRRTCTRSAGGQVRFSGPPRSRAAYTSWRTDCPGASVGSKAQAVNQQPGVCLPRLGSRKEHLLGFAAAAATPALNPKP